MIEILYYFPLVTSWLVFLGAAVLAYFQQFKNPWPVMFFATMLILLANYDPIGLMFSCIVYYILHYQGYREIKTKGWQDHTAYWYSASALSATLYVLLK